MFLDTGVGLVIKGAQTGRVGDRGISVGPV